MVKHSYDFIPRLDAFVLPTSQNKVLCFSIVHYLIILVDNTVDGGTVAKLLLFGDLRLGIDLLNILEEQLVDLEMTNVD